MNINLTPKYLQFLRKSHNYTQEELAENWIFQDRQSPNGKLVIALMGASPDTNQFCERLFPEIDFEKTRNQIGRVRVETVKEVQEQIVSILILSGNTYRRLWQRKNRHRRTGRNA